VAADKRAIRSGRYRASEFWKNEIGKAESLSNPSAYGSADFRLSSFLSLAGIVFGPVL